MNKYTNVDINILNSLLKDYRLKSIRRDPDKSNGILIQLRSNSDSVVSVSVEFEIKENREYCVETALRILSDGS